MLSRDFDRKRHHPSVCISTLHSGEHLPIPSSGALMARMVVSAPEYTRETFDLPRLKTIEEYVASVVEINIPFNNPVTGKLSSGGSGDRVKTRTDPSQASVPSRTRLVFTPRVGTV